jgi:hypothetical protein
MISPSIVVKVSEWLDREVAPEYRQQPMAQDWARVSKIQEELGEATAELILYTGQNPRKGKHPERKEFMLKELGDVALTAIFAIQHFTNEIEMTREILIQQQIKIERRVP